jgi:hypothetical protein
MMVKGQSSDCAAIHDTKKAPRHILQARAHLRKEVMILSAVKL